MTHIINSESDFFDAKDFRSAMLCAAKNDPRYYLNSVCLCNRYDSPMIVSTNGHVLLAIDTPKIAEIVDKGEHIIIAPFKLDKSCHFIRIEKQGDELIAHLLDNDYGLIEKVFLKIIDAIYPDVSITLDSVNGVNHLENGIIGIAPKYIDKVDKVFHSNSVILSFKGTEGAVKIISAALPSYKMLVMPVRLKVNHI